MQVLNNYIDVSVRCYGTLAAVHKDGTVAFNKRSEERFEVSDSDAKRQNTRDEQWTNKGKILFKNGGIKSGLNDIIMVK